MKKRLLSVLLSMCMVLGTLPGMAWAMDNDFIIENGVLTQYRGPGGDVAIPDSVTSIGDGAFAHSSNLTSVTIPNSVTSIGGDAFYGCRGLTNVVIPNSVASIRGNVFRACTDLTAIQVEIGNPNYASEEGVLFNKSMDNLVCCPSGKQGLYTIPNSVTHIGISAFYGCAALTNVVIPDSVTDIGSTAFNNCTGLTSATIPGSVTIIGGGSFNKCTALTDVTISDGVVNIGNHAFAGCTSLANVVVPNSITGIGSEAFYDCRALTNIAIPNSVDSIGNNAFTGCSKLTVIQVASSNPNYTSIDGVVFNKNMDRLLFYPNGKRGSYTIPSSVTSIGYCAFRDCIGLTSVTIPGSVTSISQWAFADCTNLTNVVISNGATLIDSYAFYNCTSLINIAIPSSVADIGGAAFGDCNSLTDVYYSGTETQWKTIDVMYGNDGLLNATIHYNSTGPGGSGENPAPGPDIPSIPDTDMSIKKVNLPFNGHSVSANWGWNMFNQSAVKNQVWDIFDDNNLAIAGLALSRAAEDSQQQVESILGNENYFGFKAIRSKNYASTANQHPAVTFASKPILQNGKGEYVVAIVVRGTQPGNWDDYWTDISSLWGGFSTAADNLQIQLNEFLVDNCSAGIQDLRGKVKFFVTGHSLGAAVANVMAKNLSNEYGADNVFAYTFASPTTIQSAQSAGNIFNILNIEDGVTKLPGLYDHRHGWEVYFHRDLSAEDGFYNRFKELTGRDFNKDSAHDTVVYMSYLLSMSASSRNTKVTLLHVLCPVDIEIYSSQNQLVGQVRDNIASDTVAGKTYIRVVDDEKYIYLLGNDSYSINLFGTDEGTMEYTVQNIDLDNSEALIEKTFENVTLSSGKKFISKVDVQDNTINGTDVLKVPLYVLDSAGNPEKNVLPDGKGTEVPIDTPLECEHNYTANVTAPTCTECGYTTYTCTKCGNSYVDTYTAALGHSYGEWTVVTPATTTTHGLRERICARCSDRQTNVIPATGGGSSHDNPGSSSSDPTYRIDAPSKITGGTIKITPTSARENQRVTITVKPNTGYILEQLTATNNKGDALTLADKGDGKYTFMMPKGKVTVNAVFQPIEKPWSNPFQDVIADMWCYNAVRFVSENDLMNGISSNLFAPNTNLSRAQLAQILYNKEGRPEAGKAIFTDVPDREWYSNAVAWAAEKGVVSGYGNGLFGPVDNITREQLAVMLWRYAGSPAATNKELHFADMNEISSYALEALCWATENGIINGYGNGELAPKSEATRAQAAQMIKNFLDI